MSTKIRRMLPLLQSSDSATVHKCINDLNKLSSVSARELLESGIYELVYRLSLKNDSHIRHAAKKLYDRWTILVAAYERCEFADRIAEEMAPECADNRLANCNPCCPPSNFKSIAPPHSSPRPPATPEDVLKFCNSGDSSRSDEPTFHHGLEPERKSKNSRIHDPLQLESVRSHDSLEPFRLRADSGSSSGNSQRSGSADPMSIRCYESSANNQTRQFGNGLRNARTISTNSILQPGSSSSQENVQKWADLPVAKLNGVTESSPEDPNLSIEGSSEPTLISGGFDERAAVEKSIVENLTIYKFEQVKGSSSNVAIPTFNQLAFLWSRQGLTCFMTKMGKYYRSICKNSVSEGYLRKSFEWYVNHGMRDLARMPTPPANDHTFDFDRDFRIGMSHHDQRSSGYHGTSSISSRTVTEGHNTRNSSNHPGSIQVPSMTKPTTDSSKHEPNTFPVPSHKDHCQTIVHEALKRKSDKSFPLKQPEQNITEPPRKVPKAVNSHSSLQVELTTASGVESHQNLPKASGSHSGFQGNQTVNFSGESSRIAPKTASSSTYPGLSGHKSSSEVTTSRVARILRSVPALEDPSHLNSHSSSTPSLTLMDALTNPNIQLISPIASPERVPAAAPILPTKEKKPKHRSKAGESPILKPSTSRLSPNIDVVNRLSTSMTSPAMELARPGSSKGIPSVDVKVPNPNGNHGPSTSKGASKETSREKKPRQTKKKPEKGKLWAQSKKDFDVIRKRN